MDQFCIAGDSEYIEAAYAVSNRSSCRSCKQKIAQQSIRLSYNIEQGDRYVTYWYHLNCFELKKKFAEIDPMEEIYNIDQLDANATDMDLAINYIEAEKLRIKNGIKRSKVVPTVIKGKKESEAQDDQSEEQFKETKKGAKKNKQSQKQGVKKSAQQKKIVAAAYTPQQQKQFDELIKTYSTYTGDKLRQILSLNNQTKSANKIDLVQKCADGKILGQIPLCAKCGGGRPRFDRFTATYKCVGYMDDDKYRHCNKTFAFSQIQRSKWIDQ